MYTGEAYNVFLCFVISLTSLIVFFNLRKIRKNRKVEYSEGLDYFTLSLGLLWGIIGIRKIFNLFDRPDLNIFLFQWVSGPLNYIHLLPAFNYLGWNFFKEKKKIRLLFNGFFALMIFLTVLAFFKYEIITGELGYWGSHHEANKAVGRLFIFTIFLPALICILIEFVKWFRKWRQTGNPTDRQLLGFSIGFLIYAITGAIDTLGIFKGWAVLLVRVGMMLAPLTFYLSAAWED